MFFIGSSNQPDSFSAKFRWVGRVCSWQCSPFRALFSVLNSPRNRRKSTVLLVESAGGPPSTSDASPPSPPSTARVLPVVVAVGAFVVRSDVVLVVSAVLALSGSPSASAASVPPLPSTAGVPTLAFLDGPPPTAGLSAEPLNDLGVLAPNALLGSVASDLASPVG